MTRRRSERDKVGHADRDLRPDRRIVLRIVCTAVGLLYFYSVLGLARAHSAMTLESQTFVHVK